MGGSSAVAPSSGVGSASLAPSSTSCSRAASSARPYVDAVRYASDTVRSRSTLTNAAQKRNHAVAKMHGHGHERNCIVAAVHVRLKGARLCHQLPQNVHWPADSRILIRSSTLPMYSALWKRDMTSLRT